MKNALLSLLLLSLPLNVFGQAAPAATVHRLPKPRPPIHRSNQADPQTPVGNQNALVQSLPIRRVTLYSNGVAYIERRGAVTGHAEISLSFKQSQVDDVLKSMIVLDLGKGRIGAVSYNSSAPPSARMADIPFSIESGTDNNHSGGLAAVLGQLQGARVVVATASRVVSGSILTIEERKAQIDADKPAVITHALVIASETGELVSLDLAEVRSVKLVDEGARRDVSEFASASASARRRDAKTIIVTSDGTGSREMLVSYTIAAPIWKTTYRVVLDQTGKPFFQGWAIVDNVGDEDWNNISLSLVSGTPVSFIQPIQKPFYRYRPVVPMPGDLKLDPQVYEPASGTTNGLSGTVTDPTGAMVVGANVAITNTSTNLSYTFSTNAEGAFHATALPDGNYKLTVSASGFKKSEVTGVTVTGGRGPNVIVAMEIGSVTETVVVTAGNANLIQTQSATVGTTVTGRQIANMPYATRNALDLALMQPGTNEGEGSRTSLSDAMTSPDSGVEAAATGNEVGDLFEYKIDQPVTVPHDRSALIPIVQTRMDGERVSIYNEATRRDRPMGGMLLKNTTPLTLEDGSMTVIDGDAYAGEALMERLKPEEKRLISFALDLGTLVTARVKEDRAPTFLVRIVRGVFQAHYHQTTKKNYTLTNQTDKPRVVIVEHPVRQDWTLTDDTQKPDSKSARYYRFRVPLAAHQTADLAVTERRELMDVYELANFTKQALELFVARNYIDASTQAVLERIIDLKGRMTATEERLEAIEKETAEIAQDQQRLRDNIKALTSTAEAKQLITRYVNKANDQETRLEQIEKDRRAAVAEHARLQAELEAAIRGLSLDRKVN